ncbi:MAG: TRAP transporter small permease subunit [Holophagales bacterium]|nr:TRAP transporter small permease subunit [Holophagales bacterium]
MASWTRVSQAIDGLSDRIGALVGWLTLSMVLIGSYNTLARYVDGWRGSHQSTEAGAEFFRFSSNAFLELQWYLFSVVFLLGAAYTLRRNAHVRVDVFYGRLGAKGKAWVNLVGTVLMLIPFSLACLWLSWPSVRNSWAVGEQSPDPGGLARYPIKTLLLVAFVLLLAQAISELGKHLAVLRGDAADPLDAGGEGDAVSDDPYRGQGV